MGGRWIIRVHQKVTTVFEPTSHVVTLFPEITKYAVPQKLLCSPLFRCATISIVLSLLTPHLSLGRVAFLFCVVQTVPVYICTHHIKKMVDLVPSDSLLNYFHVTSECLDEIHVNSSLLVCIYIPLFKSRATSSGSNRRGKPS